MNSFPTIRAAAIIFFSMLSTGQATEYFPAPDPPELTSKPSRHISATGERNPSAEQTEWIYHKTADSQHPNGMEQRLLWFINRARMNPTEEGIWLATETDSDVRDGRDYFNVDISKLEDEFAAISPMPPAAFDRRLYEAARVHCEDLITRNAQDHNHQFDRVTDAGFKWNSLGGVVYSFTKTALHAHAAFNIDWGNEADGMQTHRGHRVALMSDNKEYTNTGFAIVEVTDESKSVGPFVTTGNFAHADNSHDNSFNSFIVGTVWNDENSNDMYDLGEGLPNVTVSPATGDYYAVTSDSGGYALPITADGSTEIRFSGGTLPNTLSSMITLSTSRSILLDQRLDQVTVTYYRDADHDHFGDPSNSILSNNPVPGYTLNHDDCDDTDPYANPGQTWFKDQDNDLYSNGSMISNRCLRPSGYKAAGELHAVTGDNDDSDPNIHPDSFVTLTVSVKGNINERIESIPSGISCPGLCTAGFPSDQHITLTTAYVSSEFPPVWNNLCDNDMNCDLVLDKSLRVSVRFRNPFPWATFFPALFPHNKK